MNGLRWIELPKEGVGKHFAATFDLAMLRGAGAKTTSFTSFRVFGGSKQCWAWNSGTNDLCLFEVLRRN